MELKWDNSDGFGRVTQMDIERYVDGELKHVITKESEDGVWKYWYNKKDIVAIRRIK